MPTRGTVKRWARGYGFAEAVTGEVVYIHSDVLPPRKKLKLNGTVYFDMIEVTGHNGRVKGVNVTGPGIVDATAVDDAAEQEASKKLWEQFKSSKMAGGRLSTGSSVTPRKAGAGVGRGRGSAEEKRVDPADGGSYTQRDFQECYGGLKEWHAAAPKAQAPAGRGRGRGSAPSPQQQQQAPQQPEKRIDAADGRSYTREQFHACYNGYNEWNASARVQTQQRPQQQQQQQQQQQKAPSPLPKLGGKIVRQAPYQTAVPKGRGGGARASASPQQQQQQQQRIKGVAAAVSMRPVAPEPLTPTGRGRAVRAQPGSSPATPRNTTPARSPGKGVAKGVSKGAGKGLGGVSGKGGRGQASPVPAGRGRGVRR
ncbi:hypothetical protein DIPPA_14981 [Diplonema papillatum]|nr:hypothetical protein DIPPA_14981 [Diplonema papillatum]